MSEVGPGLKPTVAEVTPIQNAGQNPPKTVRRIFQLKPQEVIKSQIAAFTAETVPDHTLPGYFDRKHVFSNISNLAKENPKSVTRVTTGVEYDTDANGKFVTIPSGTERLIATNEEYLRYLRSVSGSHFEAIQGRTDMLTAYEQFAPEIAKLKEELADSAKRKDHPAFLGAGSNSMVFRISRDGKDYAVRVPNGKDTNPLVIDSHLAGAILGKGIPHLEQIVAASYEDGTTVAEMIPGKEIGNLSVSEIENIADAQLAELIDTLILANERGIEIDPKPSNFFYDAEQGFGVVDYHSSKGMKNSDDQNIGRVVGWIAPVIGNAGFYGKSIIETTAEEYSASLVLHQAELGVLRRLTSVAKGKLQGDNLSNVLEGINSRIKSKENIVERYSNPAWVSEQIKAGEDSRRLVKEQKPNRIPDVITVDLA